jgi:hypothetical protein
MAMVRALALWALARRERPVIISDQSGSCVLNVPWSQTERSFSARVVLMLPTGGTNNALENQPGRRPPISRSLGDRRSNYRHRRCVEISRGQFGNTAEQHRIHRAKPKRAMVKKARC